LLLKNNDNLLDLNHNNNNSGSNDPIRIRELLLSTISSPIELAIKRSLGRPNMLPLLDRKEDQINSNERTIGASRPEPLRRR